MNIALSLFLVSAAEFLLHDEHMYTSSHLVFWLPEQVVVIVMKAHWASEKKRRDESLFTLLLRSLVSDSFPLFLSSASIYCHQLYDRFSAPVPIAPVNQPFPMLQ